MFNKVSHIGIAVKDLQASVELFSRLFGKAPDHTEDVPDQRVKTAFFTIGSSSIELTQGTDVSSPVARFLEKRGEGVHHVSFVVDNIEQELARLKGAGFQLIEDRPRVGADGYLVAFLHPHSTNGVLIEISQKM
ncbi:MAG: methylmalonyl-CoA epimerase [Ignavibacteriales bacterium]|nr:methylmalonyl-CoA epimerase [Ignavibacteriales bacterium]